MRSFALDLGNPISNHPDNAGLALALIGHPCVPGVGGGSNRWPDLTRKTAGGTLTNGPTWSANSRGFSLRLDGANDYVTIADSPAIAVGTQSFWFQFSANLTRNTGVNQAYIDKRVNGGIFNGIHLYCLFGNWGCQLNDTSTKSYGLGAITSGQQTITWVVDRAASMTYLYSDARLVGSASIAAVSASLTSTPALRIGLAVDNNAPVPMTLDWLRHGIGKPLSSSQVVTANNDPATDPRLNRITGRTYYLPLSTTPSVFAPAFGPGWGFAA